MCNLGNKILCQRGCLSFSIKNSKIQVSVVLQKMVNLPLVFVVVNESIQSYFSWIDKEALSLYM